MKLFDILKLEMPSLNPEECKLHLAVTNPAGVDPLDELLADRFVDWQRWQKRKNFERRYIVSLIKQGENDRWLFAGVHLTQGCRYNKKYRCYYYKTSEVKAFENLTGRLVVTFARPGRQCRLCAENWADQIGVSEYRPLPLTVGEFPGFTKVLLPKPTLDIIVRQEIESWKSALSSVAGVYLITDTKTGRHYVGSAYGSCGIWGRWVAYSESGHGNNKYLKRLLHNKRHEYSLNFQFSILETADTNASKDEIIGREAHWKDVICSRVSHGGYNEN
jgi:hypothetical protein